MKQKIVEKIMNRIIPALYETYDALVIDAAYEKSRNNLNVRYHRGVEEGLRRFKNEVALAVRKALMKEKK